MTDTDALDAALFPSPEFPTVPVRGERAVYPVHRTFCVGRNYAEHAAIGAPARKAGVEDATKAVLGYATGLDMTRRDPVGLTLGART